jgi:AcrR family transcriptional regulator
MSETAALTREKILETAEDVLRRYGPSKATVVDVARALGVSHGSVYRHFASKADLRDAVVEVWLGRMNAPLEAVAAEDAPAADRLYRWLKELSTLKRRRHFDDPELFAAYCELASEARAVVGVHVEYLVESVSRMIREGAAKGEWSSADPAASGQVVLVAMMLFHNPVNAAEWSRPDIDTLFEEVWAMLLKGLKAP